MASLLPSSSVSGDVHRIRHSWVSWRSCRHDRHFPSILHFRSDRQSADPQAEKIAPDERIPRWCERSFAWFNDGRQREPGPLNTNRLCSLGDICPGTNRCSRLESQCSVDRRGLCSFELGVFYSSCIEPQSALRILKLEVRVTTSPDPIPGTTNGLILHAILLLFARRLETLMLVRLVRKEKR